MAAIQEIPLVGIGLRRDFMTRLGDRIGVISYHTGQRDLLIYDRTAPHRCQLVVRLEKQESHILADLLDTTSNAERPANYQRLIEDLTTDRVLIAPSSPYAGRTIQDIGLPAQMGVMIVAVTRGGQTILAPPPDFHLQGHDTVTLVGSPPSIRDSLGLLQAER